MLDSNLASIEPESAMPRARPADPSQPKPLFAGRREACRLLGGIGKTSFYDVVRRHHVQLVHLGGRSLVPMSEIERVAAELMQAAQSPERIEQARAAAAKSVSVRRRRRGDT